MRIAALLRKSSSSAGCATKTTPFLKEAAKDISLGTKSWFATSTGELCNLENEKNFGTTVQKEKPLVTQQNSKRTLILSKLIFVFSTVAQHRMEIKVDQIGRAHV